MNLNSSAQTLWLFGLPAAGKTTLAKRIAGDVPGFVLLDGDDVRRVVANFDMGQNARLMHLSYMAFCCRQLNASGVSVAAAFVTPLEAHRARIREILPAVKFIWVRCAAEVCAARDPKGLWGRAARGELPQLTGAGGEWEGPMECALTLDTDRLPVEDAFAAIKTKFGLNEANPHS